MRRFRLVILLICIAALLVSVRSDLSLEADKNQYLYNNLVREVPDTSTYLQPNGPFAVMIFNESVLSAFIGVIYYKPMTSAMEGAWMIDDRFWQKGDWVSDVTSFAWGKSGKYLYVGTRTTYGNGGLFKLDLLNRKSERIFPTEDIMKKTGLTEWDYSTEILSLNFNTSRMKVELFSIDEKAIKKGVKGLREEIPFE